MTALIENKAPVIKENHISASQLRTYSMCSLKWLYSRKYTPEFKSSNLLFGAAFHAGLALYYQNLLEGEEVKLSDMVSAYSEEFDARDNNYVRYSKNTDKDSLLETASHMFEMYLKVNTPGIILAVEEKVEVNIHPELPVLTGYIDLLEIRKDEDGREYLHIVDFKTSARKPSLSSIIPDQLLLYHHAIRENGISSDLGLPVKLRYDYITKTKNPELISVPVSSNDIEMHKVISKAVVLYEGMKQNLCYPNPGWQCDSCGYQTRCKAWTGSPC